MSSYAKLLSGYADFREQYQSQENAPWRNWAKDTQSPKVMIIACSDSRVNPVIITNASLGEIFTVNNVANLVPPYEQDAKTFHGTSAAIEFAVAQLKVEHIIIMGHSGCGGIRALMTEDDADKDTEFSFIRPWMEIVEEAKKFTPEEKSTLCQGRLATLCEQRASLISLENLKGYPWVIKAIAEKELRVHAWHYDIGSGILQNYSEETDSFEEII